MKNGTLTRNALRACVSLLAIAPVPVFAQAEGAQDTGALEEILVTARRVDESLQRVPVAVSALSGAMIDNLGAQTPGKLNAVIPNVAMVQIPGNPSANVAMIRGIGTTDPNSAIDPAVGTYIDGVYIGRMAAANAELADVARLEVLRGPQGTLFGRNTTGGAISIVTKAPSSDLGAEQKLGYGGLSEFYSRTRLSTGNIGDTGLSATATYLHRQRGGEVNDPNRPSSRDPGAMNVDAVWTRVRGQWGDLTVDYSFDQTDAVTRPPAFQIRFATPRFTNYYANSPSLGGSQLVIEPDGRRDDLSVMDEGPQRVRSHGHHLTAEFEVMPELTIKSISAYRKFSKTGIFNYGPSGLIGATTTGPQPAIVNASRPNQYQNQKSQELQAFGTIGEFSYLTGLYYFKEQAREEGLTRFTSIGATGLGTLVTSRSQFRVISEAKAAFGQLTYRPEWADDRLEAAGGLRYSNDKKDFLQLLSVARSGKATFENTSYNFTLSYRWLPSVLTFARVGSGYRSGGFNTRAAATASTLFRPEKAKVYELGLKSELLDRHVRFNATLFYTDYKDLQVSQFSGVTADGTQGLTLNAAAEYKGFETELIVTPLSGLTLYSNVGYTDASYSKIFFPNPANGLLENYAKQSFFAYVPKWTVANGISYSMPAGDVGTVTGRIDHRFTSKRYFNSTGLPAFSPFNEQLASPGYSTFDARLTLAGVKLGSRVTGELSFWVDNLFNKDYIVTSIDLAPSLGFAGSVYGIPRRAGVEFKVQM